VRTRRGPRQRSLNIPGFIASQNQWSLAKADASKGDPTWAYIDESFIDWHTKHGFAAFPYTPQANGYFRRLDNGSIAQASDLVKALFHHPQNENRYKRIKALQSETGYNLGEIVLGYLLGQPFPVFPIVGPRKAADLDESPSSSRRDPHRGPSGAPHGRYVSSGRDHS